MNNNAEKKMENDTYDFVFKIILLGDTGVGKSNLIFRFTKNAFNKDSKSTIGVEFAHKTVQIEDNRLVKAQLWDTAGQERFRSVASSYYRGAVGVILVYDITDGNSFNNLPMWLKEVENNTEKGCLVMLVGNKMDLNDKRSVDVRDGRDFARKNRMAFIETSALQAKGVDKAFERLLQEIYLTQTRTQRGMARSSGDSISVDGSVRSAVSTPGRGQKIQMGTVRGQKIQLGAAQNKNYGAPTQRKKQNCCSGG